MRIIDVVEDVRGGAPHVHGRQGLTQGRGGNEIGVHAVRGGDITGDHTVLFAGDGERVELTHRTSSRRAFALGTLRAIRFVAAARPGLYGMREVLGLP
jgi:4-hydroxy-tetrahydrodipicolinate reductase